MVADCKNPFDRTKESRLAGLVARISLAIHGFWIPAIHAGMTAAGYVGRAIVRHARREAGIQRMDSKSKPIRGVWIPAIPV
jgi:hypothetical protein